MIQCKSTVTLQWVNYFAFFNFLQSFLDSSKVDSDSENEDPDNEDVIDRLIYRLPDAESDINDFLTRSLAIFMLLR